MFFKYSYIKNIQLWNIFEVKHNISLLLNYEVKATKILKNFVVFSTTQNYNLYMSVLEAMCLCIDLL